MGVVASYRSAGRIASGRVRLRGRIIGALAVIERLLAPGIAYALLLRRPGVAAWLGVAVPALMACRGALQRAFTARTEGELYRRTVSAVLSADALQPTPIQGRESRVGLFEGLHRVALVLIDTRPNLMANLGAALAVAGLAVVTQPMHVLGTAALCVALCAPALLFARKWVDKATTQAWGTWDQVATQVADAYDGRFDLVTSGSRSYYLQQFERCVLDWQRKEERAARASGLLGRMPLVVLGLGVGSVVLADSWIHGASWVDATLRAGLLVSFTPPFLGLARGLQELVSNGPRLRLVENAIAASAPPAGSKTPPVEPTIVEWKDLTFTYGDREVLRDVTIVWKRGEVLGLAGANGSGKSTCLRTLVALRPPLAGSVLVNGMNLADLQPEEWRRRMAFLPQRPYLPTTGTVRDALLFLNPGLSDETMRRALDRVGLAMSGPAGDVLECGASTLSAGERQRVALARALCREAPLLVLDEPDANLDRDGIHQLCRLVRELAAQKMVLIVAHTPELLQVTDRVITLEEGQVRSNVVQHGIIAQTA